MLMIACRCVYRTHMLMITCRYSHSDVRIPMCLSNCMLMISCWCVCRTHMLMITCRCVCRSCSWFCQRLANKNRAKSHPLLNEGTCIREYSTIRPSYNGRLNDLKEMCSIGLNFEYSRMRVPSLSSGCDFARFLFATWCRTHKMIACRCSHADVSLKPTCWW
jgi:hypothetical protein